MRLFVVCEDFTINLNINKMNKVKEFRLGRMAVATIINMNPSVLSMRPGDFNKAFGHMFVDNDVAPSLHLHKYKKHVINNGESVEEFILGKRYVKNFQAN